MSVFIIIFAVSPESFEKKWDQIARAEDKNINLFKFPPFYLFSLHSRRPYFSKNQISAKYHREIRNKF